MKLGMANPNYVVKEFGGSAGGIRYQPSESSENPMLELNLDLLQGGDGQLLVYGTPEKHAV